MMKKKKWLSMILACCMVVGMLPAALASEPPAESTVSVTNPTITLTYDAYTFETTEQKITAPKGAEITSVTMTDATGAATPTITVTKGQNSTVQNAATNAEVSDGVLTFGVAEAVTNEAGMYTFTSGEGNTLLTLTVEDPGQKANEADYPTQIHNKLQNSCMASAASGTITLTKDITIDKCVTVDEGEDIVLDIGTYTLSSSNNPYTVRARGANTNAGSGKATLTILGTGTIKNTSDGSTTVNADVNSVLNVGTRGAEDGPTILRDQTTLGKNSAIKSDETAVINIYAGTLTNLSTGSPRSLQSHGTTNIYGGTFKQSVEAWTYETFESTLNIFGGTFESDEGLFGGQSSSDLMPTITVTGGTFKADPSEYVPKTHHVTESNGTFTVKEGAEVFAAKLDTRGNSNISVTPFTVSKDDPTVFEATVSGTVDMRTYVVADTVLQEDFASLLADARNADATVLNAIPNKYVKAHLNLVFADIDFLTFAGEAFGKTESDYYYIQQTNKGMGYVYSDNDDLKDGVKGSARPGTRDMFKDGLTFLLYDQTEQAAKGDVEFKIAPCAKETESLPTEKVTTFIIHNNITFTESTAPEATDPVVEVVPAVNPGDKSATATVDKNAVTEDKVNAAAEETNKTLVIDASAPNGDITKTEITLENDVVTALADGEKAITTEIKTPVGTVSLPAEATQQISGANSDVKLVVEQKAPTGAEAASFVVSVVKADGSGDPVPVSGLAQDKPIVLSFNIGPGLADQHPQLFYKDEDGKLVTIPSTYDPETGILTGKTTHLSDFVQINTPTENGGLGKVLTITPGDTGRWITVQVTKGGSNAIYSIQQDTAVTISAPINSTVTVWETSARPDFNADGAVSNGVTVYSSKTVNI